MRSHNCMTIESTQKEASVEIKPTLLNAILIVPGMPLRLMYPYTAKISLDFRFTMP